MSYITKDKRAKWDGVIPDGEGLYLQCEKCGSKKIRLVSHFDGRETYGCGYNCENGHCITKTMRRDGGEFDDWTPNNRNVV